MFKSLPSIEKEFSMQEVYKATHNWLKVVMLIFVILLFIGFSLAEAGDICTLPENSDILMMEGDTLALPEVLIACTILRRSSGGRIRAQSSWSIEPISACLSWVCCSFVARSASMRWLKLQWSAPACSPWRRSSFWMVMVIAMPL